MARQKIKIRLRAYEPAVLDRSAEVIVQTALKTGALVRGPIPQPTKKSVFSITHDSLFRVGCLLGLEPARSEDDPGESPVRSSPGVLDECESGRRSLPRPR